MTSQEIQSVVIKTYLKPILKEHGYRTSGNTWWKNMGDFFIVINLQNSQWNTKSELSFCLNIGVALTEKLADNKKQKATYFDLATQLRQDSYLADERLEARSNMGFEGWLGYKITDMMDASVFVDFFKVDIEENILETLSRLKTIKDCVDFYDRFEFWGNCLRRQLDECNIEVH